jgi:hypothetical protein
MAKMITRTISTNSAEVTLYNAQTRQLEHQTFTVTGKTEKAILKEVAKLCVGDTMRPVSVDKVVPVFARYGMTEADFLAHALKLPLLAVKEG